MIVRVMLLAITAVGLLSADSLRLRDGRTLTGNWFGADEQTIRFVVNDQVQTFTKTDVVEVIFGNAPSSSPAPAKNPPPAAENFEKTQGGLRIKIDKCEKHGAVSVTCSLTLESVNSDQQLSLAGIGADNPSFLVDSNGMKQNAGSCKLGSASGGNATTLLVQGTPVRGELQFKGVDPSVDRLAMLTVAGYTYTGKFDRWKLVFRNIPLQ